MRQAFTGTVHVLALLLILLPPYRDTFAQNSCPFPSEAAVPDTLPAQGYYPLALGNVWEYEVQSKPETAFPGELRREEVVGDTVVAGRRHWKIRTRRYAPRRGATLIPPEGDTLVVLSDRCCTYRTVDERGYLIVNFTQERHRLGHPSNACYNQGGTFIQVRKYTATRPDSARKNFSAFESHQAYDFGWGLLGSDLLDHLPPGVHPGPAYLHYAHVSGRSRGQSFTTRRIVITPVGIEQEAHTPGHLRAWPNPAQDAITMAAPAQAVSGWTIRLYDLLGRLVVSGHIPASEDRVTLDIHTLAPGLYRAQAQASGFPPSNTLVIVR